MMKTSRFLLWSAVILSAWAATGYWVTGGANTRQFGLGLGAVIAWYFFTAMEAALVVQWLSPWARSRLRGAAVGFAAALLPAVVFNFTMTKDPLTGWKLAGFVVGLGVMLGAPIGAMYWRRD